MTKEEAVCKFIKDVYEKVGFLCFEDPTKVTVVGINIYDALIKQIHKKLIKDKNGWLCPSCEAFFATYKGNFIDTNYCPNCGQRIDWSEE